METIFPQSKEVAPTGAKFRSTHSQFLINVMPRQQKRQWLLLTLVWLTGFGLFWTWWLHGSHSVSGWRTLVSSIMLLYVTGMPALYFFFVWQMKKPNPNLAIPPSWRVAMVVTKTPSEPFAVVRNTLEGMLEQRYPHDVWLADEAPTPETIAWCQEHGVHISSREGVEAYHRPTWPRRTKSKEGNLAYFYDHFGYDKYDFVVQMDADHRPASGYLEEMLRPFVDEGIGYVSAPSICDANLEASWTVKGRLHAEAGLHGALQAGHNNNWAPLCIGSHYAVRTAALQQIGGLGPELAEDHSTTLLMNANGWRGVHALDAEAHGDGPASFSDCMTQEFQWSRSLTVILLTLTPKCLANLPIRLKIQFLYAQLWYPIMGLVMLLGYALPLAALIMKKPWMNVVYGNYLMVMVYFTLSTLLPNYWIRRNGWLRSKESSVISWQLVLFQITRWPWILSGCCAALYDVISGRPFQFRVTPKGENGGVRALSVRVLAPYFILILVASLVVILTKDAGSASGYYYFALLNIGTLVLALFVIIGRHAAENRVTSRPRIFAGWQKQYAAGSLCLVLFIFALSMRGQSAATGILWGRGVVYATATGASLDCNAYDTTVATRLRAECRAREDQQNLPTLNTTNMSVNIGVYDPERIFDASDPIAIDHIFVSGTSYEENELDSFLAEAGANNRWPLITVEPWGEDLSRNEDLLQSVTFGRYDPVIEMLCRDISQASTPAFVRWGHEMENVTGRYPWAQADGDKYISAYRHFVDRCRLEHDEIYYVWSPLGHDELSHYWPGTDYADYVGLSVYHFPEWEEENFERTFSFEELFSPRYDRVRHYGLPIMIAELGVTGDEPMRTVWLNEALASTPKYPQLRTIVYFNAVDTPGVWGDGVGTPDWRLWSTIFDSPQSARSKKNSSILLFR